MIQAFGFMSRRGGGRAKNYKNIKQLNAQTILLGPEKYLNLLPKKFRTIFIKFRTANHHLPIETGRWCGTPKLERTCHICKRDQINR